MSEVPSSDRRPDWSRLAVLAIAGIVVFAGIAFVALGGGGPGAALDRGEPEPEPVRLAARGAITATAVKVREILATYGESSIAEGVARTMVQRALSAETYPDDAVRDALADALASGEWTERWVALMASPMYGPADGRWIKLLVLRTFDDEPRVRSAACQSIADIRAADDEALAALRRARDATGPEAGASILRALVRTRQPGLKPLLLESLGDEDVGLRRAAAFGLAAQDLTPVSLPYPHVDLLIPLIDALGDADGMVRMYAAQALSRMAEQAEPAIDALIVSLADPETYVAGQASVALSNVGAAALPSLRTALASGDRQASDDVIWVLRQLGGDDARSVVRAALHADDALIRARAAAGLYAMGDPVGPSLEVLTDVLSADDVEAVLSALRGLGRMGREADPARADLVILQTHADPDVRRAATNVLSGLRDPK